MLVAALPAGAGEELLAACGGGGLARGGTAAGSGGAGLGASEGGLEGLLAYANVDAILLDSSLDRELEVRLHSVPIISFKIKILNATEFLSDHLRTSKSSFPMTSSASSMSCSIEDAVLLHLSENGHPVIEN